MSKYLKILTIAVLVAAMTTGCLYNSNVAISRQSEQEQTPEPEFAAVSSPPPTPTPEPTPTPDQTTDTAPTPDYSPPYRPPNRPTHRPTHRPTSTPSPTPTPTPAEIPLMNRPYLSVLNPDWFVASGTQQNNAIWLNPRGTEQFEGTHFNYVVYWLGLHASAFRATLTPPPSDGFRDITMVYSVHGQFQDGSERPLYRSPTMTHNSASIPIDVNVRGVMYMRIELEVNFIGDPSPGFPGGYRGIENAIILTTDY